MRNQNGMFYQSVIKNNHDANKVREIYLDKRYADGENSSEQPNNVKIVYYGDGKTPSLVNIKVPITNEKNEETGHKEIIASFFMKFSSFLKLIHYNYNIINAY